MRSLMRRGFFKGIVPLLAVFLLSSAIPAKSVDQGKNGTAFLGVNLEKMSSDDREEFGVRFGVLVIKVLKGEAADKAGVKKYDVIQFFNGVKIRRPDDLSTEVRKLKPGTDVKIVIVRDGKSKTLKAVLGERRISRTFELNKDFIGSFGRGAYLGVQIKNMDDSLASYFGTDKNGGALVISVDKGTAAEKAGIMSGDVIVNVDKRDIRNADDLFKTIKELKAGDKVKITLIRHKKKISVTAVLEKGKWGRFMNILRFPEKGVFNFGVPYMDRDEMGVWNEEEEREVRNHLREMKEKLKEEKIRIKEELKRTKENVLRVKEAKERELRKLKELKRIREYIYI